MRLSRWVSWGVFGGVVLAAGAQFAWAVGSITINSGPSTLTGAVTAQFTFSGTVNNNPILLKCSLSGYNGGTPFLCQSPFNTSSVMATLPQGQNSFYVQNLTYGLTSTTWTWTVDSTPPTQPTVNSNIPLNSTTGTYLTKSPTPSFTFSATDPLAGIAYYDCAVGQGTPGPCTSPYQVPASPALTDGTNTFFVTATDNAGNTSSAGTFTWTQAANTLPGAPTITANVPASPAQTNITSPIFTFSSTDSLSLPLTYSCNIDLTGAFPCTSPFQLKTALKDRTHEISIIATDPVGNASSSTAFYWTQDTVAPTVPTLTGPPALTNQTSATIVISTTDSAPIASYTCTLGSQAGTQPYNCSSTTNISNLSSGSYTFTVTKILDSAGNSENTPVSYTWTVDTAPPSIPTLSANVPASPAYTNILAPVFTFSSTDPNSLAITYICAINGQAVSCSGGSYTVNQALQDGSYTFSVVAQDAALNKSSAATFSWQQLSQTPVISLSGPVSPSNQLSPTLTIATTDPSGLVSYLCTLNGAAYSPCGSSNVLPNSGLEPNHQNTFAVTQITDGAGNTATNPGSYIWNYDVTAPVISSVTVTPGLYSYNASNQTPGAPVPVPTPSFGSAPVLIGQYSYTANPTLNWTVQYGNNLPGSASCTITGNNGSGSYTGPCPTPTSFTPSSIPSPGFSLTPGVQYTFTVTATDQAGNQATSAPVSWTYVSQTQQQLATTQTATSASACSSIQPFYYEVGTGAQAQMVSGSIPSSGSSIITRTTSGTIASASKWIFGAYAVQTIVGPGQMPTSISTTASKFLTMSSGYDTFSDNSCSSGQGVTTALQCENQYCLYTPSSSPSLTGFYVQVPGTSCGSYSTMVALNGTYDNMYTIQQNSLYTEAHDGHFSYSGGHFQRFSIAGDNPNPSDGNPQPYGFTMDNDAYSCATCSPPLSPTLTKDVMNVLAGPSPTPVPSPIQYSMPSMAGGANTDAADYIWFLQQILNQKLQLYNYLGANAVCTLPASWARAGSCNAVFTPIAQENMHYSYGHWVEDDYTQPFADGAFNSAGAWGFYPWIDSSKYYYGVVARFTPPSGNSGPSTIGTGYSSELCGREIRYSFITGLPYTQ